MQVKLFICVHCIHELHWICETNQGNQLSCLLPLILQFPEFIAFFFSRLSWPSVGNPPPVPVRNVLGNLPSFPTHQIGVSLFFSSELFNQVCIFLFLLNFCMFLFGVLLIDYGNDSNRQYVYETEEWRKKNNKIENPFVLS